MKQIIFGQLNKEFFEKHQKLLLFIANCWFLKWIIGTNRLPKDIKGKRINRILPASVHYKTGNLIEKKVSRKGFRPKKILVEEWKMCAFTRPRFAESLSHRLYYFWKLCHLFDIQIANKLNPAWNLGFDSASYFSGAGDGGVYYNTSKSWATTHDTADGTGFFLTNTAETFAASGLSSALFYIVRGFLPFDTSGLPDNATISAALVYVYVSAVGDGDNDGDDWLNVVQGLQADPTTLVVGDYDACGDAVTNPTEGATRIDLGNITASQYNSFTLNATGRGWISKTGYTKLGVREGHDCINSAYAGADGTVNRIAIRYSEYTGTGSDPYLSVTYTTGSFSPSISPSISQSISPSISPSVSPSVSQSLSPSLSPSLSVSISPSISPSLSPSISESISPSISPSNSVSVSESISPSISPSVSPSQSISPSLSPSLSPSISQSISPSISPSISQSISPSISPSLSPSSSPSLSPSISPSISPSASPSLSPSYSPSLSPSISSSLSPSISPSYSPSLSPSVSPSPSPTEWTWLTKNTASWSQQAKNTSSWDWLNKRGL